MPLFPQEGNGFLIPSKYLIRSTVFTKGGGLLFIKINLQTRLLIVTRLVNEA